MVRFEVGDFELCATQGDYDTSLFSQAIISIAMLDGLLAVATRQTLAGPTHWTTSLFVFGVMRIDIM